MGSKSYGFQFKANSDLVMHLLFKALFSYALLCTIVLAYESIHYFDLKNRSAEEVIPIIVPFLQANEAISGDGYQLFIKTNTARAKEIESLINTIDKAAKSFRISVTNDEHIALSQNSIDGSVTIKTGDAEIQVGSDRIPEKDSGITVDADVTDNDRVTANWEARTINSERNKVQFIQVQEGKPAFISRENIRLIPVYSYVKRPYGVAVIDHSHTPYSREDGFYVEARAADDRYAQVSIQTVSGLAEHHRSNEYEQQYAETNIRVPFGQWFEIGGSTNTYKSSSKGILYKTEEKEERYSKIYVKIELAK